MSRRTVYLAGPMRGIPLYNFPEFDAARDAWARDGWTVISPADLDRQVGFDPYKLPVEFDWRGVPAGFDFPAARVRDIAAIEQSQAIVMLRGWENSKGARAEKAYAEWCGLDVLYQVPPESLPDPDPDPDPAYNPGPAGEVRIVDPTTGGEKGSKLARFDLLPEGPLWELAEHFGRGARKYADDNWRKGYSWRLSFAAAMRHLWQFWRGEDIDQETGSKHTIAAAWHCLALAWFMDNRRAQDDRPQQGSAT